MPADNPAPPLRPELALHDAAVPGAVQPAVPTAAVQVLAHALQQRHGERLHLGTSSWHFPGWAGRVWARPHPAALLSRAGLSAYAAHPLLRTVSLDRAFYRAPDRDTYAALAAQVPAGFRFVVKASASALRPRPAAPGRARRPAPGPAARARGSCRSPAPPPASAAWR